MSGETPPISTRGVSYVAVDREGGRNVYRSGYIAPSGNLSDSLEVSVIDPHRHTVEAFVDNILEQREALMRVTASRNTSLTPLMMLSGTLGPPEWDAHQFTQTDGNPVVEGKFFRAYGDIPDFSDWFSDQPADPRILPVDGIDETALRITNRDKTELTASCFCQSQIHEFPRHESPVPEIADEFFEITEEALQQPFPRILPAGFLSGPMETPADSDGDADDTIALMEDRIVVTSDNRIVSSQLPDLSQTGSVHDADETIVQIGATIRLTEELEADSEIIPSQTYLPPQYVLVPGTISESFGTKISMLLKANEAIEAWGGTIQRDAMNESYEVNLQLTRVTDDGLVHLQGLPNLRVLDISRTRITDAGLEHLQGLTSLEWLVLSDTQITGAGVQQLQAALPGCRIWH